MVRPAQVGRSRGCLPCRNRRIKCDLTIPKCKRCLESGRDCPGPLTGLFVIESQRRSTATVSNARQANRVSSAAATVGATALSDLVYSNAVSKAPFLGPVYETNLLTKFLQFFCRAARTSSWTFKLPQMRTLPSASALRSSLRAVSLAYAAVETNNDAVRFESYQHYGWTLQRQRAALTHPAAFNLTAGGEAAVNALAATVMLSYFELISCTNPSAWFQHTVAAEKLLVVLGPESLCVELIGQLFSAIRTHAAHRAIIHQHPTVLAEPQWLETPYAHIKQSAARSAYEGVVDFILRLSRRLHPQSLSPNVLALSASSPLSEDGRRDSMMEMLLELEQMWNVFMVKVNIPVDSLPLFLRKREGTPKSSSSILHERLQRQFPAMTTAYFHTAALTLLNQIQSSESSMVPFFAPSSIEAGEYSLEHHASQILACGIFLLPTGNGTACLRMVLPFSVVRFKSPSEKQGLQAKELFESWANNDGLPGLVEIAFGPGRTRQ